MVREAFVSESMLEVGFIGFLPCVYCDIIHIDRHPTLCYFFVEDGIHHYLKCGQGIGEAKEHHSGFEQTLVGEKCHLPLIAFLYADVVVSPLYIKLREERASAQSINCLWDERRYILVLLCVLV